MTSRHLSRASTLLALLALCAAAQDSFERNGATYVREPWGLQRPVPTLTEEEEKRGWVGFVPCSLDGIGPQTFPSRAEIGADLLMFMCPGEYQSGSIAVYASRETAPITITPGQLMSAHRTQISPSYIQIRTVRIWNQRTSWNTTRYHALPELLDPVAPKVVPAGGLQQYWITIGLPEDAPPDLYEGYLRISDGQRQQHIGFRLRVLPFAIKPATGKLFGLWPDTSRWRRYTDEQILAEISEWRQCGINTCIMYPLTHGSFSLEGGELKAELAEFQRFMGLYVRGGMGEPVVASLQGVSGLIHRLLGQTEDDYGPEFAAMLLKIAGTIEDMRVRKAWPRFVYHTVDEPGGHPAVQREALETLRILHDAGYVTFTTADIDFTNQVLAPYLDCRCYSVGYCATSAQQAAERRQECDRAHDAYWWYGTGCYTGQEGSVGVNRHLGGFLLHKTGAGGAWAWTFQRPQGDAYDDFDGQGAREQKDACITYPQPGGGPPLVSTLQWEGIREGIDDVRYLQLLEAAMQGLTEAGTPAALAARARVESQLERILADVPWLGDSPLTNAGAEVLRWRICELLFECARAIGRDKPREELPAQTAPVAAAVECTVSGSSEPTPEPPIPVGAAPLVDEPPTVDGLQEPAWSQAEDLGLLTSPEGLATAHQTRAWAMRSAERVYLAFLCHEDRMDAVRAEVTQRDGPVWSDDSVEVFVDADGDQQTYAHFVMNSIGTRYDSFLRYKTLDLARREGAPPADATWDLDWSGAASRCEEGWFAEIELPIRALGAGSDGAWTINLNRTRRVGGAAEYACWSPTGGGYHVPARFGKLLLSDPGIKVASVQLSGTRWGDNMATIRVGDCGNVADLQVSTAAGERPRPVVLTGGEAVLEAPYQLRAAGANTITLELAPQSVWRSPDQAARYAERDRREREPSAPAGAVRPYRPRPVRLSFRRWIAEPMVLDTHQVALLQGWPGFDLTGRLNLGRRTGNAARLSFTLRGQAASSEASVERIEGDRLNVGVATSSLPPGEYQVEAVLTSPDFPEQRTRVPFTILRGPWE